MQNRSTIPLGICGILATGLLLLLTLPTGLAAQATLNGATTPNGGGASETGGTMLWAVIGEPITTTASATGSIDIDDLYIGSIVALYPDADLSDVEEHQIGGAGGAITSLSAAPTTVSDEVTFTLTLARPGVVHLAVYDMLGRTVAVPIDRTHEPGVFSIRWRPGVLPPGQYIARLTVDGVEGSTLPLQFVH